ncbi:metallophosphoesterase, partial [Desulfobacterota bacterium AH_259_B03_O07]|nr:metallophosphoesterase [Desulfobacterota bacterium AH_259_B03_O07]
MKTKQTQYEMAVVANDLHVPHHDEKALKLLERFLVDQQPDVFIINGDFLDMWEVSQFDRVPKFGKSLTQELKEGRKMLQRFRKILPKAKIIYIEGNHDFRLRKYLIRNAPELYGLPGLSIPDLLGLKELNIIYKPVKEGANKFSDNWIRLGDLYVGHWDKVNKHAGYTAKNLLDDKGVSLLQGHTHRHGVSARRYVDGKELIGIENFCLCRLDPYYISKPNWSQGFSVVYRKKRTRRFHVYPIIFVEYKFFFG